MAIPIHNFAPVRALKREVVKFFGKGTGAGAADLTALSGKGFSSVKWLGTGMYKAVLDGKLARVGAAPNPAGTTITLASVSVDDVVIINGVAFTAKATANFASKQFSQAGTNTVNAASLAGAIQYEVNARRLVGVSATSGGAVVFLNSTYPHGGGFTVVSSNATRLAVGSAAPSTGIVHASGTVTAASVSVDDTVTINGVVFTAKAAENTALRQFNQASTDTAAAASLVACVTAAVAAGTLTGVIATSSSAVVTVRAVSPLPGTGNAITLASSNGTRLAVSGPVLTGGSNPGLLMFKGTVVDATTPDDWVVVVTGDGVAGDGTVQFAVFKGGTLTDLTTDEKLMLKVVASRTAV